MREREGYVEKSPREIFLEKKLNLKLFIDGKLPERGARELVIEAQNALEVIQNQRGYHTKEDIQEYKSELNILAEQALNIESQPKGATDEEAKQSPEKKERPKRETEAHYRIDEKGQIIRPGYKKEDK